MQSRMSNPVMIVPDALQPLMALGATAKKGSLPAKTRDLVHLRTSQINGCSFCVDMTRTTRKETGETEERLLAVAAWRDAPYFTDAERAALALAEAETRLSDRADPVPDAIWEEAARHYDEPQLAQLVLCIAVTNLWNRINVTTRQVAGAWPAAGAEKAA